MKFTLAAAFVAAVSVTTAYADTVIIDGFDNQGVPITGQFVGLDITGEAGADGTRDVYWGENPGSGSGRFGVDARNLVFGEYLGFDDLGNDVLRDVDQFGNIARDASGNLIRFSRGDTVSADDFQSEPATARLYDGDDDDFLASGETVILGFRFDIFETIYSDFGGGDDSVINDDVIAANDCSFDDGPCGDVFVQNQLEQIFGFIELTRGSVTASLFGYNTNGAAVIPMAAPMTPVPLPAGGLLLLSALGAGAFLRRKKA